MARRKQDQVQDALQALAPALKDPETPEARQVLVAALRTGHPVVAARIAARPAVEAKEAASALRHRCFEPGLAERILEAAAQNPDPSALRAVKAVVDAAS